MCFSIYFSLFPLCLRIRTCFPYLHDSLAQLALHLLLSSLLLSCHNHTYIFRASISAVVFIVLSSFVLCRWWCCNDVVAPSVHYSRTSSRWRGGEQYQWNFDENVERERIVDFSPLLSCSICVLSFLSVLSILIIIRDYDVGYLFHVLLSIWSLLALVIWWWLEFWCDEDDGSNDDDDVETKG